MSKKTIFFDDYCGYQMSVIVEDGKITEFGFEEKDNTSIVGNIYKGRVESVLPGMNAAFINCGLERNCYLSTDDIFFDKNKYDGSGDIPPSLDIHEGDEIAVQVVKAPVGTKGARVSANLSFVGKHLIYMPSAPFVGVSRKIADDELRKNLIYSAERMKTKNEGIILRTASPYARRGYLEQELDYLRNLYNEVKTKQPECAVGDLLYSDLELPMRVMRDTLSYDIERIIVGSPQLEKVIRDIVNLYPAANRRPVLLHDSGRDMLAEYGLSEQIHALYSSRVNLDNGAYLVIEKTEALTSIDVNTGKFTGDDSLEQTVYYTNILAAREIARQVKLRNIGGIVVVDFIDMADPAHAKSLVTELKRALKNDPAKCCVAQMSEFGLVEFTRKRVGGNPLALMSKPCKHCKDGKVKTPRYALIGMRAKLLELCYEGNTLIRVDMNGELLEYLSGWREFTDDLKERLKGVNIYAVPRKSYSEDQITYRCNEKPDNAIKLV
ncbi:MAG: Rne/Rng family ribonuclease [Clostridia bacterium]|nr:Rne/Rng family ribonuclease [Clostridia bacterium]